MKLPNFDFFEKSFVSLVITPRGLKVVKLNTKTNSVVKFGQVTLPPGVIMNYRVKEKDYLVTAIRELWAKNKISDRYVGVVVPEFSSYTKSFTLPNLSDTEISEALGFKMQEFLPTTIDEVVFDWKIIKREKDTAHVSVVAILKDVLFGYIDAVGAAGLSPLVVETPSLSVQRLLDQDESAKLIIYVSTGEAILVISSGTEIVASSVVTTNDFNVIVSTARQMLTHYSTVSIQKVIVSGVGITQDLIQFLNYNLGKSIQFASPSIKGLMPGQIQDFLIGISLQHKDPVEPRSELTINLLPPSWAEYYKKQSAGMHAWTMTLVTSIVIWSTFLFVLIVFMFLNVQVQGLQNGEAAAKSQELNEVVSEVNKINALAAKVIAFDEKAVSPGEITTILKSAIPPGVTVNNYKINYESGEIILGGISVTRDSLLLFKNALEEKEELERVELPISSLIPEGESTFEIRMYYKQFVKTKSQPAKLKLK